MAVSTYLVGNDGNVSFAPSTATNNTVDLIKVRSFAANISRVSSDQTGFGDSGKRRRLGVIDLTGSLNGVPGVNPTTVATSTSTLFTDSGSYELTLTPYDGSATTDAKIVATVVFSSFAFNSDKNGDASVTANFENSNGSAPVVTWLT